MAKDKTKMNLEQSEKWLKSEIEKLKKERVPNIAQIRTYQKYYSWLSELNRYRLMWSEIKREIELTEPKSKEELLELLEEEFEDWQLTEIEE